MQISVTPHTLFAKFWIFKATVPIPAVQAAYSTVTSKLNIKEPWGCYLLVHFHNWFDYNGVAFSIELLEWDRTFSGL